MSKQPNSPTWHFPCEHQFKIVCVHADDAQQAVLTCIGQHLSAPLAESAIKTRASSEGKYLSLTVTIMADSKQQLDDIYHDLSANPIVKFAL